ncbi:MAG: SigE family RNA polymerase sigma factor [Actinomycetota bacterium]|nr:SigE family RNA polymerase sigma factor [Actinomycetota bacterium]
MDDPGFESLCRQHYGSVVRTAYLITGDASEAVDLAQETFARAFERWDRVSTLDRPEAWLHRVVANLSRSWWRRRLLQRQRDRASEEVAPEPEVVDPRLMEALRALPPAQRTAVVLRFYADRSIEEVAQTLGKRPGTVRALTSQAVARLRSSLDEALDDEEVPDEDAR